MPRTRRLIVKFRAVRLLALAAAVSGTLHASGARADAASEARAHYERALKFYDDAVYDAALVELTRAYELNPSHRILYNIAQTRLAMRDYAGALEAFQRYLREGGGQVGNERVTAVRNQLNELTQRVGKISVETDVLDSEVLVDDVVVGTAPLSAPLVVNAGVRRVMVRHPDYPTHSQRVSVASGEQLRVVLPLRPHATDAVPLAAATVADNPPPSAAAPAEPSAPPPHRETVAPAVALHLSSTPPTEPDRTLAYIGTGLSGALAATAIVLGVVTMNKNEALEQRRKRPDEDPHAYNEARGQLRRLANITDVFTLATIAAAGVTTWLWLRDGSETSEHAARHRGGRLGVALLGPGAQLRGEF